MGIGVVLLSGGLDSATVLGIADSEMDELGVLTFIYGQKADREVNCARDLVGHYGAAEHKIVNVPLEDIANSSLLKGGHEISDYGQDGIPDTYVPARNIIMLSLALSYAESIQADAVYIGANAVDFSGYPDCRPEFYKAFRRMAKEGTRRGVEGNPIDIRVPLQNMSKAEIIQRAEGLGVPLELTWSCYRDGDIACGTCDSCRLRLKGFEEAGLDDPIDYE